MSFLPIVDRELRVAARRWSTFLVRLGVALVGLLIALPTMFFGWLTSGGNDAGQAAFSALAYYALVVCAAAGVVVTADCLSSEKRDGTLGLLFLTDLKGYDVVLGKFSALCLHTIYGLVAVFPALSLPLLAGGVTGGEFWRTALALLNLLFVSLSAGMLVSALSRDSSRALGGTLLVVLLLMALLPVAENLGRWLGLPAWITLVGWASPWHPFALGQASAYLIQPTKYWGSLGLSHLAGWLCLAFGSVALPRSWQDTEAGAAMPGWGKPGVPGRLARVFRVNRRVAVLDRNPVLWLMGDRPVLRVVLWSLAGGWSLLVLATSLGAGSEAAMGVTVPGVLLLLLLFAFLFTEHSCRFWVESRRTGALESLLAIPITSRQIIASHWASLRRHFLGPMLVTAGVTLLPLTLSLISELMKGSERAGELLLAVAVGSGVGALVLVYVFVLFLALGWTGFWLALKLRRPEYASGLTLLYVLLLPHLFCYLGFGVVLVFLFVPWSILQSNLRNLILQHYAPAWGAGRASR